MYPERAILYMLFFRSANLVFYSFFFHFFITHNTMKDVNNKENIGFTLGGAT